MKILLKSILLVVALSPCLSHSKSTANAKYRFKQILSKEAKTAGVFKDAVRDDDGYLWIAIWGSLLRYDGHEIVSYKRNRNHEEPVLIDETLVALAHDPNIGVLAGSVYGLLEHKNNRFNYWVRSDEEATRYIDNKELTKNHGGIPNDKVNSVYVDTEGTVWLGMVHNFVRLDREKKEFTSFAPWSKVESGQDSEKDLSHVAIVDIFEESQGVFLVATVSRGLLRVDTLNDSAQVFEGLVSDDIDLKSVSGIAKKNDSSVYLSTNTGLLEFNRKTNKISRSDTSIKITEPLTDLFLADNGEVWVSGRHVYMISDAYYVVKYDQQLDFKISSSDSKVGDIYVDEQGTVSVFYNNHGIFQASPLSSKLRTINDINGVDNNVRALERHGSDRFWAGFGRGLISGKFDGLKLNYDSWKHADGTDFEGVRDIHIGANDTVWIAEKSRISKITDDGKVASFDIPSTVIEDKYIYSLAEDSNGAVWFSVRRRGIFKLDPSTGKVSKEEALAEQKIELWRHVDLKTANDRKTLIYIKSGDGFGEFDVEKRELMRVHKRKKITRPYELVNPFRDHGVWSTFKAGSTDSFWVSHDEPFISKFDPTNGNAISIDVPTEGTVFAFASDDEENLFWVYEENGALFYWSRDDNSVERFGLDEGLPPSGIKGLPSVWLSNDIVIFPSRDGLIMTSSETRSQAHKAVYTTISDIKINHKSIDLNGVIKKDRLELNLKHSENAISFEFFSSYSAAPNASTYRYRLNGLPEEWVSVDSNDRKASFTNLSSGSHIFEVQAKANKEWGDVRNVYIDITPAWYETKTAYTSVVLLLLAAFYGTYKGALRRNQRQEQLLLEKVEEQTGQIKNDAIVISKQNNQLLENNARIKELVISIAHELRTPLSVINGINTKIKGFGSSKQISELVKQSNRNISGISRKIDLLLLRAKLENKAQIPSIKLNLSTETLALVEQFKVVADVNGYFLDSHIEKNIGVEGDPYAFEQLVANLISNAIKYNTHKGSINIHLIRESDAAILTVTDTGCGISKEGITKITEKWSQESISNMNSSGLGMSLVKEITSYYGGTLDIDSEIGRGTKITISIPCFTASRDSQPISPSSGAIITRELSHTENYLNSEKLADIVYNTVDDVPEGEFILLVEDNAELAIQLSEQLSIEHKTIVARNGLHALELIDVQLPTIIISDILMPKMDGFELVSKIKSTPTLSFIPFILLTANADENVKLDGLEFGANDFLAKPVNEKELRYRINNILAQLAAYQAQLAELPVYGNQKIVAPAGTASQLIKANEFKQQMSKWMETIFPENPTVADATIEFGFSNPDMFTKYFKSLMGVQPSKYISRYKVEKAAKLLTNSDMSLIDISFECGFNTATHLSREFKKVFDTPPGKYRSERKVTQKI